MQKIETAELNSNINSELFRKISISKYHKNEHLAINIFNSCKFQCDLIIMWLPFVFCFIATAVRFENLQLLLHQRLHYRSDDENRGPGHDALHQGQVGSLPWIGHLCSHGYEYIWWWCTVCSTCTMMCKSYIVSVTWLCKEKEQNGGTFVIFGLNQRFLKINTLYKVLNIFRIYSEYSSSICKFSLLEKQIQPKFNEKGKNVWNIKFWK